MVHTQTVPLSFLISPISFSDFGSAACLNLSSFHLSPSVVDRQKEVDSMSCTDRLMPGGSGGVVVAVWRRTILSLTHTHIDSQSHTRTLLKVSVSREER